MLNPQNYPFYNTESSHPRPCNNPSPIQFFYFIHKNLVLKLDLFYYTCTQILLHLCECKRYLVLRFKSCFSLLLPENSDRLPGFKLLCCNIAKTAYSWCLLVTLGFIKKWSWHLQADFFLSKSIVFIILAMISSVLTRNNKGEISVLILTRVWKKPSFPQEQRH